MLRYLETVCKMHSDTFTLFSMSLDYFLDIFCVFRCFLDALQIFFNLL